MSARDDYPWLADAWLSNDSMDQRDAALDEIDRLRSLLAYISEWQVDDIGDVLHCTGGGRYDHRTSHANNLLAMFRSAADRATR